MSVFWERFSMLCESYNQTPNVVAENLGIASSTVSEWEKGSIPNEKQLLQLCIYFGERITYFLSEDLDYGYSEEKRFCEPIKTAFWKKFSMLCESYKCKPNSVGKEIGIYPATIAAYRRGKFPSSVNLVKIAQYFDVSIEYLISDSEIDIKPSKKRTSFAELNALPQRWESLRTGNTLSTDELLKVASFVQTDIAYLSIDSISYSPNYSTVNKYDFETYELILGIFDRCADSTLLKTVQIQLSRIVLFWLEKKGFDVDSVVSDKQLSGVSSRKLLYLKSGVTNPESAYNFGLNFTELDVLREKTGLSFFYMLTGIESFPVNIFRIELLNLRRKMLELKVRLEKIRKFIMME